MRVDVRGEFQGTFSARRVRTSWIVIHHAAALYPTRTAIEDIRAVHTYHKSKGWGGIGYHEVLAETTTGGPIGRFLCSGVDLQRAHIALRNHECYGISALTNFNTHPNKLPGAAWLDQLAAAVADARRQWPTATVVGHTEAALPGYSTSCPGDRWFDWKGDLLDRVERLLGTASDWHAYETIRDQVPVRTFTSRSHPVAWDGKCILPIGFPFIGREIQGTAYGGASTWIELQSRDGFVHSKGNVRAVPV